MDYTYDSYGVIAIKGCAALKVIFTWESKFNNGSEAFILYKAKRGVLEKVVIKKIFLTNNSSLNNAMFGYIDTYNRSWNESELAWFAEAKPIALNYLNNQIELLSQFDC